MKPVEKDGISTWFSSPVISSPKRSNLSLAPFVLAYVLNHFIGPSRTPLSVLFLPLLDPDCFLVALKALLEVDAWYLPPILMLAFLLVHSSHSPLEFSQLPSSAGKHPA